MKSLDDLLAKIDAEHKQKSSSKSGLSSQAMPNSNNSQESSNSIDNLLAQTQSAFTQKATSQSSSSKNSPDLEQFLAEVEQKAKPPQKSVNSHQGRDLSTDLDELLGETKKKIKTPEKDLSSALDEMLGEVQSKKQSEAERKQQERDTEKHLQQLALKSQARPKNLGVDLVNLSQKQEQQRLEAKREQRKREALKERAKEWLSKLELHSEEGLWFEEFAYAYNSKLDAAMDYLQALKDVT